MPDSLMSVHIISVSSLEHIALSFNMLVFVQA